MKKLLIFFAICLVGSCYKEPKSYVESQKVFQENYYRYQANYSDGIKETEKRELYKSILDSSKGKLMINWQGKIKDVEIQSDETGELVFQIEYDEDRLLDGNFYYKPSEKLNDSIYAIFRDLNNNDVVHFSGFISSNGVLRDDYQFTVVDLSKNNIQYSNSFVDSYSKSLKAMETLFLNYKNNANKKVNTSQLFESLNDKEASVLKRFNSSVTAEWMRGNVYN